MANFLLPAGVNLQNLSCKHLLSRKLFNYDSITFSQNNCSSSKILNISTLIMNIPTLQISSHLTNISDHLREDFQRTLLKSLNTYLLVLYYLYIRHLENISNMLPISTMTKLKVIIDNKNLENFSISLMVLFVKIKLPAFRTILYLKIFVF